MTSAIPSPGSSNPFPEFENHLGETWALFDLVEPGLLGDELRFRRWYRMPIEQARDEERLGALRELVAPRILRRLKRDVAKDRDWKREQGRLLRDKG